ncbi:excision repair enzyme ERCC-1 [Capsaspora owczarzaki ATCC 30864]|uniref:DNA excision repair protein ERCC-1 n=1 Tax=Capsaspora owczarzaki (strain ATCC 30864) TaxID=595528 RepID=A0A0D2X5M3_CAPO3|nr:excision repair enzyme ERCC-1 [Capsaspora owczarzaki ATCC 30864]KJE98059.1 excision repair enzyme ERCC-1 [Capsaspora owczarzaki ATCC 30864]|eukprot:XP_004342694.1 excision repair enzyme ERCC-1 [Capsaspora owczarzaki ATCC 30864]
MASKRKIVESDASEFDAFADTHDDMQAFAAAAQMAEAQMTGTRAGTRAGAGAGAGTGSGHHSSSSSSSLSSSVAGSTSTASSATPWVLSQELLVAAPGGHPMILGGGDAPGRLHAPGSLLEAHFGHLRTAATEPAGSGSGVGRPGSSSSSNAGVGVGASSAQVKRASSTPTLTRGGGATCLQVNKRQEHNPMLKCISGTVPYEIVEMVPDFVMGRSVCALYLSLRYHLLHPEYLWQRMRELRNMYELRILLILVDIKDTQRVLRELTTVTVRFKFTVVLAWSEDEAARYLETYKMYESKPADALKERIDTDFLSRVTDILTSIKSVNKTDVITLLSTFGSLKNIANATPEQLSRCPGIGEHKVRRIYEAFHQPFTPDAVKGASKTSVSTAPPVRSASTAKTAATFDIASAFDRHDTLPVSSSSSTGAASAATTISGASLHPVALLAPSSLHGGQAASSDSSSAASSTATGPRIGQFRMRTTSSTTAPPSTGQAIVSDWRQHLNSNAASD